MTTTTDDDLIQQLRDELVGVHPQGPGPDLRQVALAGLARRRRRRAALAFPVVGLAAAIALVPTIVNEVDSGDATGQVAAPGVTSLGGWTSASPVGDEDAVEAVLISVLDEAGIAVPPDRMLDVSPAAEGGGYDVMLVWRVSANDGGEDYSANLAIQPGAALGSEFREQRDQCKEEPGLLPYRRCVSTDLPGGGWVQSYESLQTQWWSDSAGSPDVLRSVEWQPSAQAGLPNGTFVMLNVTRDVGPGPAVPETEVAPYAAGISVDQLRAAVGNLDLTQLGPS